jgi:hypothetical protein
MRTRAHRTPSRPALAAKSIDAQPTVGNGLLVFVTGDLFIDGSVNPVKFSQVFNLQPANGRSATVRCLVRLLTRARARSFFVLNDIMKLNYG